MRPKQYIVYRLLMVCLLAAGFNPAIAQRKVGEHLFITRPFLYENGILFVKNNYVKDNKKDDSLLTGENRPHGINAFYVFGKRTAICFTNNPMPDSIKVEPLYDASRKIRFDATGILIRVTRNGKTEQDWRPVTRSTPSTDSFISYFPKKRVHEMFTISDDTLGINDILVVDGKLNSDNEIMFTYYIRRIPRPLHPRLLAWAHDWQGRESRISPEMINKHIIGKNRIETAFATGELQGGDGAIIRNERIAPTSSFIFYFGKADNSFADSSMEYRILGGRYKDSSWIRTGHLIMMDGLTGNEHYSLEVRYSRYPENTETYTYYTLPYWYQTNWFKGTTGAALFLLLLALAFFGYRRRLNREKEKKALLSARLQAMQAQLNPHFIFNALSSIQALMNKQENDKAHQYLSTFGSLLRNVLTNSNHDHTTLDQEIKSLEAYLQLEQLRSGFQYKITVANDLQTTIVTLPVMLLQPLIENAIRHGIGGIDEKGKIRISFIKDGNDLLAKIEDNGKGFDTDAPADGYGLKLVEEKIRLINALQGQQALQMNIRSSAAGTTVLLTFKNWLV
jgi:anti-sigma regulatory factor (Ser/Thr protein kinase)